MTHETTRRALLPALALALLTGWAGDAAAELRAELGGDGRVTVDLQVTHRGPWTATGPLDDATLNPLGDLRGDGTPGTLSGEAKGWAAWAQPGAGIIELAETDGRTWVRVDDWPAQDVAGRPLVLPLGSAPAVLWQEGRGHEASVSIAVSAVDGEHQIAWRQEHSELLTAWSTAESIEALLATSDGAGHRELVWLSLPAPPFPIDVDARSVAVIDNADAFAGLRLLQDRTAQRLGLQLIVHWPIDDQTLSALVIDEDGDWSTLLVQRKNARGSARALENELLKQLR